jgi:hypothetical protein
MSHIPPPLQIDNQFAYRPTSSTTAALIAIFAKVTELLKTNDYVFCLIFDYSKAFDTLSHSSVADKLTRLDLPDFIYNWVVDYLEDRTHSTVIEGNMSKTLSINSSVVQGSVLGPTLFNINSAELITNSSNNFYFKYADDADLLVPSSNLHTLPDELIHHEQWAKSCNLKINLSKTAEIVFRSNTRLPEPPPNLGLKRVTSVKMLGVLVNNKLSFSDHVSTTITACNRSLYALRVMRQHGLSEDNLQRVFTATTLSKLLYGGAAWHGFIPKGLIDQCEAFLRRAIRFGYYKSSSPNFCDLLQKLDLNLFNKILTNESHVLHNMLPSRKVVKYSLRSTGHGRCLPEKDNRNFINRMLYQNIY